MSFYCLLTFIISIENSAVTVGVPVIPLTVKVLFSSGTFKNFSLSFDFSRFTVMYLDVFSLHLLHLGFIVIFESVD